MGEKWEEWVEEMEREMRFFKVRSAEDKRDALLIFGGPEIRRLHKCLPETEESNIYINLKTILTNYFAPKKNVHYARYIFLKTTPLAGEGILSFAMRLRDKAKSCDFRNSDERILEQIIQKTENKDLIRNIIRKKWSLEQTLTEIQIMEETEEQVRTMKTRSTADVARINRMRTYRDTSVKEQNKISTCTYCGKFHPWRKDSCPAYGKKCAKCGKFNHFALVCKSKEWYRNQQRIRHDTGRHGRNINIMFQNEEQSLDQENDCFKGDSMFHPQGLQNRSAQIKKVFDTSQSLIPSNRSKRQYSYKQGSEENKSNETMTKPKSEQFINKECVQASSAMQMQLKQVEEILHKQNKKQEEILCHQMHTKEEIKNLQSSIFQTDKLLNNLVSKLTTLSSKHDNLKENYEQLSQTLINQLSERINKEIQLSNEMGELQNAHEAEICEINESFKRQIQELQSELDSAKVESSNVSIREDDEDTVGDLDDVEVHKRKFLEDNKVLAFELVKVNEVNSQYQRQIDKIDQTEIQESVMVFGQNEKDKYKSKQDKRKLLMVKQQCRDQLDVSSKADTQNTNYKRRTAGAISETSVIIQPLDLGKNSNSAEQNITERRNHVRRERRLTDEFRDEFRDYFLE